MPALTLADGTATWFHAPLTGAVVGPILTAAAADPRPVAATLGPGLEFRALACAELGPTVVSSGHRGSQTQAPQMSATPEHRPRVVVDTQTTRRSL
jgi:hypothetical protein